MTLNNENVTQQSPASNQEGGSCSGASPCYPSSLPLDQIICGDNCDVLGTFPRDCIDLVVTSPPYDDLRTYGGHDWDFYGVAWQLKRVLKPGGVIVWVVADQTKAGQKTGTSMRQALHFQSIGLLLHDTMIWRKEGFPFPETNRYYPVFEYMFVLSNGQPNVCNQIADRINKWAGTKVHGTDRQVNGGTKDCNAQSRGIDRPVKEVGVRCNVWDIPHTGIPGAKHPAMFPEALARDHIRSWSNEGEIVLDPFNGSGTTTKMARELGRRWIGIDVNEEYCEIARKRLEQQLLPFDAVPVSDG